MRKNKVFKVILAVVLSLALSVTALFAFGCSSPQTPVYYTVTFQTNGGSAVPSQQVESGKTATAPSSPTKDGYTFEGWYSDEQLNTEYVFTTAVTGDITVYAKWNEVETYTVSFESNGGSPVQAQSVQSGKKVAQPENPTREGYTFSGWILTNGSAYDFNTAVTASFTLYANWTKNVVPDNPGDNEDPDNPGDDDDDDNPGTDPGDTEDPDNPGPENPDTPGTDPDDTEDPENPGTDPGDTEDPENPGTDPDVKVYYVVTFESNCNSTVPQQRVESGKTAAIPETPVNSGWILAGWYEDENFEGTPFNFNSEITESITLYAKWTLGTFTVTFDSNGGKFTTMDNQEIITVIIHNGSNAVVPTAPVKENATFAGWYENENFEGTAYDFETAVSADITLYAKWTEGGQEPTTPTTKTDNFAYDYNAIAGLPADKAGLTQENFTGDNAFLQITTGKVTYRNKASSADGKSPDCIECKDDGISVVFKGTGTITISFASTGSSNTSSLELRNADGTAIKANTDNGENGVYEVTGTTATTLTFTVTEAGTYTIYCRYEYPGTNGAVSSRGARITAITMTDTYNI